MPQFRKIVLHYILEYTALYNTQHMYCALILTYLTIVYVNLASLSLKEKQKNNI